MNRDEYPIRRATIDRCIDGDTIVVHWHPDEQLPPGLPACIRLAKIDSPELHSVEHVLADAARRVATLTLVGRPALVLSDRDRIDRYGRLVALVWIQRADHWTSVNRMAIAARWARPYDKGRHLRRLPMPPNAVVHPADWLAQVDP